MRWSRTLRKRIGERPGHGVVGEALGADEQGGVQWILDPIDSAKNYLRGIGVGDPDRPGARGPGRVGVVSAPATSTSGGRHDPGARGVRRRRIHVSRIAELSDC